jgi:hypothetical protein
LIRINVQDPKTLAMNIAIAKTVNAIRNRSFHDRNPSIGKMVNCPICDRRHREPLCQPVYAVGRWADEKIPLIASQTTRKGVYGAATVAKKRFHPHPSKRKLQLVQRTQTLYPQNEPYLTDPVECMKESRKQAVRQLETEWAEARKIRRNQQKLSRRINALLTRFVAQLKKTQTPPARDTQLKWREAQAARTEANAGLI